MLQVLAICPFHYPQPQLDPLPALNPCLDPPPPILQPQVSSLALLNVLLAILCILQCMGWSLGQIMHATLVYDMISKFYNILWGMESCCMLQLPCLLFHLGFVADLCLCHSC